MNLCGIVFGVFLKVDKLVAVPWRALQLNVENGQFILKVNKGVMKTTQALIRAHGYGRSAL